MYMMLIKKVSNGNCQCIHITVSNIINITTNEFLMFRMCLLDLSKVLYQRFAHQNILPLSFSIILINEFVLFEKSIDLCTNI